MEEKIYLFQTSLLEGMFSFINYILIYYDYELNGSVICFVGTPC